MHTAKLARIVAWTLTMAIIILSVVPPAWRPVTGAPHRLEHFIPYLATGLAFGLGYDRKHNLLALLLVLFCGSIEVVQLFVPGRHARLSDFIVDALATCLGLLMASPVNQIRDGSKSEI
jgi:VanZ family protein